MNKNLQSFILVWLVIIATSTIFAFAMQVGVKPSPETGKTPPRKASTRLKPPSDIPIYEGAQLAKTAKSSSKDSKETMFRYLIPLVSLSTVKSFYEGEMKSAGWQLSIQSARSLDFYKEDGQRQVKMDFGSEANQVVLTIETFDKSL